MQCGCQHEQNTLRCEDLYDLIMIIWGPDDDQIIIIRSMLVSIMMAEMRGVASMSQQYWRQLGAVINIAQLSFFPANGPHTLLSTIMTIIMTMITKMVMILNITVIETISAPTGRGKKILHNFLFPAHTYMIT